MWDLISHSWTEICWVSQLDRDIWDLIAGQRYVGSHSWREMGWGVIAGQRYVESHSWTEVCGISKLDGNRLGFLAGQRYVGSHSWAEICGIS
jgi:hypothetical protein